MWKIYYSCLKYYFICLIQIDCLNKRVFYEKYLRITHNLLKMLSLEATMTYIHTLIIIFMFYICNIVPKIKFLIFVAYYKILQRLPTCIIVWNDIYCSNSFYFMSKLSFSALYRYYLYLYTISLFSKLWWVILNVLKNY